MPVDKVYPDANSAVADIPDGATVLIGGFSSIGGHPGHLLVALRDHGAKNLTIVSNSMGVGPPSPKVDRPRGFADVSVLVSNGQVAKGISSFPCVAIAFKSVTVRVAAEGGEGRSGGAAAGDDDREDEDCGGGAGGILHACRGWDGGGGRQGEAGVRWGRVHPGVAIAWGLCAYTRP